MGVRKESCVQVFVYWGISDLCHLLSENEITTSLRSSSVFLRIDLNKSHAKIGPNFLCQTFMLVSELVGFVKHLEILANKFLKKINENKNQNH